MKNCSNCKTIHGGDEWWNCTPECHGCRYTKEQGEEVPSNWKPLPMTKGDRFRSMSDEELASKIYEVLMCQIDPTKAFCDGKAGCISPEGNIDCNADKIKACIIRYLQQPAEEATNDRCATCLRWPERNGTDANGCPLRESHV